MGSSGFLEHIYETTLSRTCFHESRTCSLSNLPALVSEAAAGPVEPEFDQVAGIEGGATPGQSIFRITAQECAADIVREFERGSPAIFPGGSYRWLMKMQPLMPRRLVVTLSPKQLARFAMEQTNGRLETFVRWSHICINMHHTFSRGLSA